MLCNYFDDFEKPIIYVNQVGGQDELVFDGSSLVIDSKDSVKRLKSFEIDQAVIEINKKNIWVFPERERLFLKIDQNFIKIAQNSMNPTVCRNTDPFARNVHDIRSKRSV